MSPNAIARCVTALLPLTVIAACGPGGELAADDADGLGESSVALTMAPGTAAQILAVVNDPGTDLATLDTAAGLDARAAKGIIARRNGADGQTPSADDVSFRTIAEVDAVPYVGDAALQRLATWALAHPAPASEVVETVSFLGWEAASVVWGVNNAPAATLNAMLDARAAKGLLAARPFVTVTQMGPVSYVGPAALERLRREASLWWKAQRAPKQATLFEVKAALEAASSNLWMPSETDARFVWVQGQPLAGAPITPALVRAQLTAQHDALIDVVMYNDASYRALAIKTEVEEPSAADFFGRLVNEVDPNDPDSIARGQQFKVLSDAVFQNLTDVKVYRFGRITISTFIVGRAPTGELVGLLTGQVET